jgi:hypothetical protein
VLGSYLENALKENKTLTWWVSCKRQELLPLCEHLDLFLEPKGQSRINNLETQATLDTQDTGRRKRNGILSATKHGKQNKKRCVTRTPAKPRNKSRCLFLIAPLVFSNVYFYMCNYIHIACILLIGILN